MCYFGFSAITPEALEQFDKKLARIEAKLRRRYMQRPTAEEIKAYQQETGEGIAWCRAELTKQAARDAIRHLPPKDSEEFDKELRDILLFLLDK